MIRRSRSSRADGDIDPFRRLRAVMPEGDIVVAKIGDEWGVTIEEGASVVFPYGTRREAVEAGRRVAEASRSRLVMVGDPQVATREPQRDRRLVP